MSYTISQLRLEAPCGQSWEGMTPTERGRFCAECKLEVVDFTRFTNAQILEYFERYQKGQTRICGRMQSERLQGGMALAARKLGFGLLAGLAVLTTGCEWFRPEPPPAGGLIINPNPQLERLQPSAFKITISGQLSRELADMKLWLTIIPESEETPKLNDDEERNGVWLNTDEAGKFETKGLLRCVPDHPLLSSVVFEFQTELNNSDTYSIRADVAYDTSNQTAKANIIAKDMKALQSSE